MPTRPTQSSRLDKITAYFLAGLALWISYVALTDLALRSGLGKHQSYAWPLIVDGLILLATRAVFTSQDHKGARRYAWFLLFFGATISIASNAAHILLPPGPVDPRIAVGVGIAPPVVTLAITHLVMVHARVRRDLLTATPHPAAPPHAAAPALLEHAAPAAPHAAPAAPHPPAETPLPQVNTPAARRRTPAALVRPLRRRTTDQAVHQVTRLHRPNPERRTPRRTAPHDAPAPAAPHPRPAAPAPHHVDAPAPVDNTNRITGLAMLASGHSARAVARELGVNDRTVRRWAADAELAATA